MDDLDAAGKWDIDSAGYYASPRDSSSTIKTFRESDLYYHAIYIAQTMQPPPPTPAMRFGSLLHTYLLEPDEFARKYIHSGDKIDRRTKEGKAAWAELEAQAAGREIIDREELLLCQAIREGVMRNPKARKFMEADGTVEQAIRWRDRQSGLPMRAKFDKLCEGLGLIGDLKTTDDPRPSSFTRSIGNFGWHWQAALYLDGAFQALNFDGEFLFLACQKSPPFECVCYVLDGLDLQRAHQSNRKRMREIAMLKSTSNLWTGRHQDTVIRLGLPTYFHDEE